MSAEDIRDRKGTEQEREALVRIVARPAAGDDSDIDCSDTPLLTREQLRSMVLPRCFPRIPARVRLDLKANSSGEGHLTWIHDILMNRMEAEHAAGIR